MQIQPDVHWIEGRSSNVYLLAEEDGLTLIDAGMPGDYDVIMAAVEALQPAKLKQILVTHADIDHVGSLARVQAATNATVFAGAETTVLLPQGRSPEHLPRLIQWFINTFIKYKKVDAASITTFSDADEIPVWGGLRVMATPGHTPDHFSFFSPAKGILFAGDALDTRDGRLHRTPARITADEEAANLSAIRLLELAPATIACGHGEPMSGHNMGDLMDVFNECRDAL